MGLQNVFKTAAQTIFTAFGDVPKSVIYTHVSSDPVYDPATRAVSTVSTDYALSFVFDKFEAEDVDGANILSTDQIAMIPVENVSFIPSNHDYLTIDNEKWNVINKKTDPAKALWLLQIRKP